MYNNSSMDKGTKIVYRENNVDLRRINLTQQSDKTHID